ncbi:hypothetical protein GN156_13255 [bacterium LRH843]|nr:hypothetical protein [bacterium LRH843]
MMRTYRGIVCEKKNKYTVFLTNEGKFLQGIPIGKTPDIGEEADFHPISPFNGKVKSRFIGGAVIAAIFLISIIASVFPMNGQVMAYVQLETDTAVELGINRQGQVIALRYLNKPPAESDRRFIEWEGYPLQAVLDTVVKETSIRTSDVQVMITTVFPDLNSKDKMQEIVENAVQNVRSEHKELTLGIFESTEKERENANKHEMSIRKFKKKNQGSPMNEKPPSSKIKNQQEVSPVDVPKENDPKMHSDKQPVPPAPSNQKNNRKDPSKDDKKQEELKPHERPVNKELNSQPMRPRAPEAESNAENKNPGKGNQQPDKKQNEKNSNQQGKSESLQRENPPRHGKEKE